MIDAVVTDQEILRQVSRDTTWEEVESLNLKARLKQSIGVAWTPGLGLAAIQIHVPVKFAWFRFNDKDYYLINPKIEYGIGKWIYHEGCLSIPGQFIDVVRKYEIEYISDGKKRKAKGLKAVLIQHEVDHCDGILNIDRAVK